MGAENIEEVNRIADVIVSYRYVSVCPKGILKVMVWWYKLVKVLTQLVLVDWQLNSENYIICCGVFPLNNLGWEMIVRFIDIGGIVPCHYSNFLFIIDIFDGSLCVVCDCHTFYWYVYRFLLRRQCSLPYIPFVCKLETRCASKLIGWYLCGRERTLLIMRSVGQGRHDTQYQPLFF